MNDACTASDRLQRLPAAAAAAAAADARIKADTDKINIIMKTFWVVNAAGGECGWWRSEEAIIVWFLVVVGVLCVGVGIVGEGACGGRLDLSIHVERSGG